MQWIGTWDGGRKRELDDGTIRYYIQKRLGQGMRVSIALDVASEEDALAELALFKREPATYRTRKQVAATALQRAAVSAGLDPETLEEFLEHARKRKESGDLSPNYVERVLAPYLGAWAKELGPKPICDVKLVDLKMVLKRWKTADQKRIVALKAFTSWLRESGKLDRRDDPTLDLKVPPNIPEQTVRAKGYSLKQVEILYKHLPYQVVRDMVLIRAKTGVHETEIDRIARGKGELRRVSDPSGIEGVIIFQHLKKGQPHALSVDAQTFAAAERLLERGRAASNTVVVREVHEACEAILADESKPESVRKMFKAPMNPHELRHSFATWASTVGREVWPKNRKGVDLTKVAERMGHLGKKTTKAFYIGDHVPMMIRIPIDLEHPDDPTIPVSKGART